jgi:hypothetical protein
MKRRFTALAVLIILALAAIPFASVSGHNATSPPAQNYGTSTPATGTATATATMPPASTATTTPTTPPAPTVTVIPTSVHGGDPLTVVVDNLPISSTYPSANEFCAYLVDSSGNATALARVATIAGVSTIFDPSLTPGGVPTTGIGSYIVPRGLTPGSFTVDIALCSAGTTPGKLSSAAIIATSGSITITTGPTTSPTVLLPGQLITPVLSVGTPIDVDVLNISNAGCAFVVPVDIFNSITTTTGTTIPAGSFTTQVTIPSGYPSGHYQVFVTTAASDGSCPLAQLTDGNVLASTPFVASAGKIASVAVTSASSTVTELVAGTGVNVTVTLASDVSPSDVCLATWVAGQYTGLEVTMPSSAFSNGTATLPFTIPASFIGTATITATLGDCPTAPTATPIATSAPATPTATSAPTTPMATGTATATATSMPATATATSMPTTPTATTTPPAPAPSSFDAYTTIVVAATAPPTPTPTSVTTSTPTTPITTTTPTVPTATPVTSPTSVPTAFPWATGNVKYTCNAPGGPPCTPTPVTTPSVPLTVTVTISNGNVTYTCTAPAGQTCVMATATPVATATPTPVPATSTLTMPTATGTPTTMMATTHSALARYLVSGSVLTIQARTVPHARMTIRFQVVRKQHTGIKHHARTHHRATHTVVLYRVTRHGQANAHGRFSSSLRVTYKPARSMLATLKVTARTKRGKSATRTIHLTIVPRPYVHR